MEVLVVVLLIIAAVLFGLAAFNVPARWNLLALGLFAWVLAVLLPAIQSL